MSSPSLILYFKRNETVEIAKNNGWSTGTVVWTVYGDKELTIELGKGYVGRTFNSDVRIATWTVTFNKDSGINGWFWVNTFQVNPREQGYNPLNVVVQRPVFKGAGDFANIGNNSTVYTIDLTPTTSTWYVYFK